MEQRPRGPDAAAAKGPRPEQPRWPSGSEGRRHIVIDSSRGVIRRSAMAPTPRTSITSSRPSSGKETVKKADDVDEVPTYSQENVQLNMRIIYYSRTFLSIVGGVIAGVLGLTGISGFLCYLLIMILASGGIAAKTKFDVHSYFDSWSRVLFDGIGQGMLSFILFWTFAYDIVHIF